MTSPTTAASPPRAGRREWTGLAVLALPTLLLALDLSVTYLALPSLTDDLGAGATEQLWITDVYGFLTAGFLVTMGTLGDRVGRRKLLLYGAVAFGIASAVAAWSTSPGMLIAARAAMGVAGATLMPSTLALISNMFQDPRQRGMAFAVWMSCFMGGAAAGPVIGGALLSHFWWGSVFLLAIPVMVLLLAVGPVFLPEYRSPQVRGADPLSVALSLLAMLPLVYGIKDMARDGVQPLGAAAAVAGLAFGAVFVARQRRLADPLLDVRLFKRLAFTAALVILMLGVATQGGVMFLISRYLQSVEGFTPLHAGLWLVPSSLAMVVGSMLAPLAARRFTPRVVIAAGMGLAAVGFALLAVLDTSDGLSQLVGGIILVFLGIGFVGALGQDLVVGSVPPANAGAAAALSQTSGDFGISLGVAALGSIGAAVYGARMDGFSPSGAPAGALPDVRQSVEAAAQEAGRLSGDAGARLLEHARDAFTSGLNAAAVVSAVLVAALGVLALGALGSRSEAGAVSPAAEESPAPTATAVE
ncbi:MFS transporter [Kitasatospora sp. NPDC057518]|uniref:MFS transporter n=1 Tax=Kitasatospora sp. NPDC057518 TaxID=3346155 RepID=UPI0036C2A0B7